MPRRPSSPKRGAPRNLRICLAWRDGQPRWEPSPASRKAGLKGLDLKRADGAWMDRGEAIDAADARTLWAAAVRDAAADPLDADGARQDLRQALDSLTDPADDAGRHRRAQLQDLVDAGRRLLGETPRAAPARAGGRTVAQLIDAYFAAADVEIAASTRSAYATYAKRLRTRFGDQAVAAINRGMMAAWYNDLVKVEGCSLAVANLCLGAAGALFAWSARQDPPWIANSPVVKLRKQKARGRLVMWSVEAEQSFVAWADDNDYADLADAVTGLLWTGARPGDLCAANLSTLRGKVWRLTPGKTRRHGQEAMPAIMAPLRRRLDRRAGEEVAAIDDAFLFDFRTGRRYTAKTLGARFAEARAAFAASHDAPHGFAKLRLQDCRDTCITRLWEAGVDLAKMFAWTGHSPDSIARILREHYLVLREQGSLDMADKLAAWAEKQGMAI